MLELNKKEVFLLILFTPFWAVLVIGRLMTVFGVKIEDWADKVSSKLGVKLVKKLGWYED